MVRTIRLATFGFLCAVLIGMVRGHGRLMEPPARNAMWRFGYSNPVNYNDNEVWCGGVGVQYGQNGGKCGVCGDSWSSKQPREHETAGKFGNGILGAHYVMGQKIRLEIDLSTNHMGYFEFKLCPMNGKAELENQECMDKYPLYLADNPKESKYFIPADVGKSANISYEVLLPDGITCSQCVIQWTYFTGNTWGKCENGTEVVGCGDQETFRNCADVQIFSAAAGFPPNSVSSSASLAVSVPQPQPNSSVFFRDSSAPGGKKPLVVRSQICVPKDDLVGKADLVPWCQQNCLSYPPRCNYALCECLGECKAIGKYRDINGTDVWCHRRCLHYPSDCPKDLCECTLQKQDFY